jgi:hypothetical protein
LWELKAYTVYEHELDTLARGSSGSLFLNFSLFLLPISITLFVALLTTKIEADRLFQGFVIVATVTAIAGIVLLMLWWREHRSSTALVTEIKNRLPPPAFPQAPSEGEAGAGPSAGTKSSEPPATPS